MDGKWAVLTGFIDGETILAGLEDGWEPFGFAMVAMPDPLTNQVVGKPVLALRKWIHNCDQPDSPPDPSDEKWEHTLPKGVELSSAAEAIDILVGADAMRQADLDGTLGPA